MTDKQDNNPLKTRLKFTVAPLFLITGLQLTYFTTLVLVQTELPKYFPAILCITTIPLLYAYYRLYKYYFLDRSYYRTFQLGYYFILIMAIVFQFAWQYKRLQMFEPKSFNVVNSSGSTSADFIYFSVITIATVGYGDITPTTIEAKFLTSMEVITGIILLVIILSNFKLFFKTPPIDDQ